MKSCGQWLPRGKILLRGDKVGPSIIGLGRKRDELLIVAPGLRSISGLFGGFAAPAKER